MMDYDFELYSARASWEDWTRGWKMGDTKLVANDAQILTLLHICRAQIFSSFAVIFWGI